MPILLGKKISTLSHFLFLKIFFKNECRRGGLRNMLAIVHDFSTRLYSSFNKIFKHKHLTSVTVF